MAIVKSIDANLVVPRLDDSNYALDLVTIIGENNSAYIENEEQQTIWIGGQPHDSISLTPFYEKKALALANHKQNNVSAFSDGMVLASTPIAKCSHDNNSFNSPLVNRSSQDFDLLKYSNESFFKNLTNETQDFNSNFYKFTIGTETFTILLSHAFISNTPDELRAADTKVTLIKGNDYSSNSLSTLSFITTEAARSSTFAYYDYLELLTVDYSDINNIYFFFTSNSSYWPSGNTATNTNSKYKNQNVFVWAVNGSNMTHLNNTLDLSLKPLFPEVSTNNVKVYEESFLSKNYCYCGKDTASNHVFLQINLDPDDANSEIEFKAYNFDTTTLALDQNSFTLSNANISNVYTLSATTTDTTNNRNVYPSKWVNIDTNSINKYISYIPMFQSNETFTPVCLIWNKNVDLSQWVATDPLLPFEVRECTVTGYPNAGTSLSHYRNFNVDFMGLSIDVDKYIQVLLKNIASYNSVDNVVNFNYIFKDLTIQSDLSASNNLYNMLSSYTVNTTNLGSNSFLNLTFSTETSLKALDLYYNTNGNLITTIQPEGVKQLSYSGGTWSETFFQSGIFTNCFNDSYNRNWGVSLGNSSFASFVQKSVVRLEAINHVIIYDPDLKLHLLESSLPQTTSISLQNTDLVYSGAAINNNLIINAYDENGARIQTDVRITIEGGNMVFTPDNTTEKVITTSNANDTIQAVEIVGSGLINVSASFNL